MTKILAYHDLQYFDLVNEVLYSGVEKTDRTGTGTLSVFGKQMRFWLGDGTIPLLTSKKMHIPSIIHEILWYISGDTNIKYLNDNNVRIWNEWADENGDLGPVYGKMWRQWPTDNGFIDQIETVITELRNNPDSRRMLINAWNVGLLSSMKLPPCHYAFQFYTQPSDTGPRRLSCMLNQRSCDVGLGVPFNIAQYSILTRMVAHVVDMAPGEFIWSGGDIHIYKNHISALKEQINRKPKLSPKLILTSREKDIDTFRFEDFSIVEYDPHPSIKMEVSV